MENHLYACSIDQCNSFHPQMIGDVSIILVRNSDRIIWWTWRYLPEHSNSMDAHIDTGRFAITLWKRKHLTLGRTSRGGCHPHPPSPPLWGFSDFPLMTLIKLEARRLVFPLFALSFGRICSLMFRCVMQTFHVLALKFFFYLLVKNHLVLTW